MFYVDMHAHSVASDDSRATVEQYLNWIGALRKKGHQIDGLVLTEHRQFNEEADYAELSKEHGIVILKGSELDTRFGHFLVYGVTDQLVRSLDFRDVTMDSIELMKEALRCGAIAVPAHPGRHGIGLSIWMSQGHEFPGVRVVERLNYGNRPDEQQRADELAQEHGFLGIGGSDAHFVSGICGCMTAFPEAIQDEKDLVGALQQGGFFPVRLEQTLVSAKED